MTIQPLSLLTWNDKKRTRMLGGAAAFGLSVVLAGSMAVGSTPRAASALASMIVREAPGHQAEADGAIVAAGGRVTSHLGIINASVADVPASEVAWLSEQPAVVGVTENAPAHLTTSDYSTTGTAGSLYNAARDLGVDTAWTAGYSGQGVGVALIDSGVAPVSGLNGRGKVVNGPDLSFDGQSQALRYTDAFGHGTFMAGIIAGRDNASTGNYTADSTNFLGIAPDAHVVNVKVASADGSTDVSQILAAIDWVIQHKDDSGLNIRVLNLSFGTDSTQSYVLDPLAFAAEAAWRHGIVVVAAVGNQGSSAAGVSDPAVDPFVIAAGAAMPDHSGLNAYGVAPFSSVGTAARTPDVLAPGKSIVSLRVPGSYVDQKYAVTGKVNYRFFRGSGSSQAAAMTSGVAALLVGRFPSATPDQIKALITSSAVPVNAGTALNSGAGMVSVTGDMLSQSPPSATQTFAWSVGSGSLEAARGSVHVAINGRNLTGEEDVFANRVDTASHARSEQQGRAFDDNWNGSSWSGSSWSGSSWSGSSWSGSSWSGSSWSGSSWSGSSWSSNTWNGSSWSGSSWSGSSWSGSSWSGSSWSSFGFTSDTWS